MGRGSHAKRWENQPEPRGRTCLLPLCMCVCDALSTEEVLLRVCSGICEFKA